jgi:hypothetical protein
VNGVVARAAARLVTMHRGLDPAALSVPEEGHLQLGPDAYAQALAGYRTGAPAGVAAWVVHCAAATAVGARSGRGIAAEVAAASARG